ncbi:hypothetical protein JTB14_000344 [Gonioctena quinquepunctata]|nr:hypothetical protein JTB14_000344 [Gonioctena quinquepunctata]
MSSTHGIETIMDLIVDGYRFESSEDNYYYILQSCGDTLECSGVLERFTHNDLCEASATLLSEKLALVAETSGLFYQTTRNCATLSSTEKSEITFLTDNILGVEWHSWILQKNSVLADIISSKISIMDSAGLVQYWFNRERGTSYKIKSNSLKNAQNVFSPMELTRIINPIKVLVGGFAISTVIFIVELYTERKTKKTSIFDL